MRLPAWLPALLLLFGLARAQDPAAAAPDGLLAEVTLGQLPDTLRVGDPFVLTLEARCGAGTTLRWLDADPEHIKPLHLLKDLGVDTLGPGHFRRSWEAAVFQAGPVVIAPLEVGVDPGDGEFLLPSDSLRLTVRSVLDPALARGDSLAPKDILDPLPVPLTWQEILVRVLGGLAVLAAAWLGWRWLRRRPGKVPVVPPAPPVDPWTAWQRRLADIRAGQRWARGETIEYYADLSLALRGLLEDTSGRPWCEMTHDEVREALGNTDLPLGLRRELLQLLLESDMVKYARQWPSDARNREVLEECAAWGDRARDHLVRKAPEPVSVTRTPSADGGAGSTPGAGSAEDRA